MTPKKNPQVLVSGSPESGASGVSVDRRWIGERAAPRILLSRTAFSFPFLCNHFRGLRYFLEAPRSSKPKRERERDGERDGSH